MGTIADRLKGTKNEAALVALADLVKTLQRRERKTNAQRTRRSAERAHRSWVKTVGVRADGHVIRPLRNVSAPDLDLRCR